MATIAQQSASRLLQYLPAIYQEDPFVGEFLLAFEKVLLGREDGGDIPSQGLEETIDGVASLFDPDRTPEEFLPWLAAWAALSLRADLDIRKQRALIANIIRFYHWRGTKKNLEELLALVTGGAATVDDRDRPPFQIEVHSTIEIDTYVEGEVPHLFQVNLVFPQDQQEYRLRYEQLAREVIELEKPAHTDYLLEVSLNEGKRGNQNQPTR